MCKVWISVWTDASVAGVWIENFVSHIEVHADNEHQEMRNHTL